MSKFDLSHVTLAFSSADAAASAFDALTAEMVQWHGAGVYPTNKEVDAAIRASGRAAATAKVYASRILAWSKAGKTPKSISQMIKDGPRTAPRKVADKAPKAGGTVAQDKAQEAAKEAANDTEVLMVALRGYVAKATKLVKSDDSDRFSNALLEAIACLQRKITK